MVSGHPMWTGEKMVAMLNQLHLCVLVWPFTGMRTGRPPCLAGRGSQHSCRGRTSETRKASLLSEAPGQRLTSVPYHSGPAQRQAGSAMAAMYGIHHQCEKQHGPDAAKTTRKSWSDSAMTCLQAAYLSATQIVKKGSPSNVAQLSQSDNWASWTQCRLSQSGCPVQPWE